MENHLLQLLLRANMQKQGRLYIQEVLGFQGNPMLLAVPARRGMKSFHGCWAAPLLPT